MEKKRTELRNLKEGDYIIIDGEPNEIKKLQTSSPGKHGSAKAKISAEGIFDDKHRNISGPVDTKVEVPIVKRKDGQVLSKSGDNVQLMDMESYETFEVIVEGDRLEEIKEGEEIKYMEALGKKKII